VLFVVVRVVVAFGAMDVSHDMAVLYRLLN
jgi:hypothetical protein